MSSRTPQVGDLLIVTVESPERIISEFGTVHIPTNEFAGVIYKIELDKWGHQEKVHVQWSESIPPGYNHQYGYSGTNILNLRNEFQIIRNGKSVI